MAKFITELDTREMLGSKYAQIISPFRYESDILKCTIEIPIGFIFDYESVPLLKGTSKRAGAIHDYLSRTNSIPVVSKSVAASVYREAMDLRDDLVEYGRFVSVFMWAKRCTKEAVVRAWPGYFHKLPVEATLEQVRAA